MKTRIKILFAFLLLFSIAAASNADVVTGKVLDVQNNSVADADILIGYKSEVSNKWQYQETTSDARGAFAADLSGTINFSAQFSWPIIYAIAPGKAYSVARLKTNNVLHLDDAQTISGQILDQNGKPVSHVAINLIRADGKNRPLFVDLSEVKPWAMRFQTFTDKNGYWKLNAVPKGENVTLEVNDPRFVPNTFHVQQGKVPLAIRLRPGAIISGRMVDVKGQPLANVKLQTDQRQHAVTNTNGIFQLTGLIPRRYYIAVDAGDRPLVAPDFNATITKDGEIKKLSNVVMTPGALIIGSITNQETGKPISDAIVSGDSGDNLHPSIRLMTVHTDANGQYQLRLPPGTRTIFAVYNDKKYFHQFLPKSVDLKEGQTVTQNFTIQSGETLSGVALDNQGKPLQGILVIVGAIKEKDDIGTFLPRETVTDANGNWSISGIAPRKVQVRVGDPWATDKLVTFTLPHPDKLQLHVIPQNELPPIGRLIDTNGKPVPGVKVTLQYTMPHPSPFDIKTNTVLTSDKNGYLHFRMPLVAAYPTISDIALKGYQWTNGGDWDDKTQRFSDVNLDPLTRKIHGRVVDEHGKPVANARVLAVGLGKDETITKQDGSFAFVDLPNSRQLTLLTIGKDGVAKVLPSTLQTTVTLRLAPLRQSFPTSAQSLDALETLYNSSTEDAERKSIIDDMARYDVPRMLKMIQGKQKVFPAAQIPRALESIAVNNSQMALQWGGAHLAQVAEKNRIAVLCQLAKLAAVQNKTLAHKYFYRAATLANAIPEPKEKIYKDKKSTVPQTLAFLQDRIQLASAAAKAQPAQTRKWVDEILQFSKDKTDQGVDWPRSDLVSALAVSAPQEAARVISDSDANTKFIGYYNAVKVAAAAKNPALALSWFKQLQQSASRVDTSSLLKITVESELQNATISVIRIIGSSDPKQALRIARSIDDANTLVLAAQFQPHETALKIWREQYDSRSILSDVRLVGLIYGADKTEGKVLFDKLVKSYWEQLNTDNMMRRSASDIAYYLARYKPHESWLMLQTEWAQTAKNSRSDASYQAALTAEEKMIPIPLSSSASDQASLALAMSSVDFQEAMKWAQRIGSRDKELSIKTQRQLLEIALTTPKQRRDLCVVCFYISDSYKLGDVAAW